MNDQEYRDLQTVYWQIKDKEKDLLEDEIDFFLSKINDKTIIEYEGQEGTSLRNACRDMLRISRMDAVEVRAVLEKDNDLFFLSTDGCETERDMIQAAKKRRNEFRQRPLCKHLSKIQKRLDEENTTRYQKLLNVTWQNLADSFKKLTNQPRAREDVYTFGNQIKRLSVLSETRGLNNKRLPLHLSLEQQEYMKKHINSTAQTEQQLAKLIASRINQHRPLNIRIFFADNTRE